VLQCATCGSDATSASRETPASLPKQEAVDELIRSLLSATKECNYHDADKAGHHGSKDWPRLTCCLGIRVRQGEKRENLTYGVMAVERRDLPGS
jgi:hypothetical protein